MRYELKHVTQYSYSSAASVCHNQVHLAPRTTLGQTCEQFQLTIDPQPAHTSERLDYFGNRVHHFAVDAAHNGLTVTAESVVDVDRPTFDVTQQGAAWEQVAAQIHVTDGKTRLEAYQLSLPSRRVDLGPAFRDYASPCFAPGSSVALAVRDLTTRIHTEFEFDDRATTVNTPPAEFLQIGRGVCQDFAHLAIACVRSMGLPARYVSGYLRTAPPPGTVRLIGADASHAWFSVWCGDLGWVDFDPTNDLVIGNDHITVAWGRDYDDVCPIQGVFLGGGEHSVHVAVDVVPLSAA